MHACTRPAVRVRSIVSNAGTDGPRLALQKRETSILQHNRPCRSHSHTWLRSKRDSLWGMSSVPCRTPDSLHCETAGPAPEPALAVIMRSAIKSHCSFGRPAAETGKVRAKRGNQLSTEAPAEFGATMPWKQEESYDHYLRPILFTRRRAIVSRLRLGTALYTAGNDMGSELSKY